MPRIARGTADNLVYHVLNRGNGKQEVFHKDQDYEAFIRLLKEAKQRYPVKVFAYCLMPNHFHMVINPISGNDLSRFMQWLLTSHVRRYHKHYETSGHVWQGRFKSFIIQEDDHFLTVLRYVEGNAVRAGMVNSAKDWLWSSHTEALGKKSMGLLDKIPVELPVEWGRYVDEPFTIKEMERLRDSVNRQSPYGSFLWQSKLCKDLGLESTIRPRGRPREKGEKKKKQKK